MMDEHLYKLKMFMVFVGVAGVLLFILWHHYFILLSVFAAAIYLIWHLQDGEDDRELKETPESCFTEEEIKEWMEGR